MKCRRFELTLISASNLPDIRVLGRMKVYAVVSINGKSKTRMKTAVDYVGKTNPTWNCPFNCRVKESEIQLRGANVVVKLMCKRTFLEDKLISEVKIPLKYLFDNGVKAVNTMNYRVQGTAHGVLCFVYSFGEKVMVPKNTFWKRILKSGFSALVTGAISSLFGN